MTNNFQKLLTQLAAIAVISMFSVIAVASNAFEDGLLTFQEAYELALAGSPAIKAADSNITAATEDEGVALAGFLPQMSFNMQYQRMTGNFAAQPGQVLDTDLNTNPPMSSQSYNYFGLGINLQQTVWDFGRTLYGLRQAESNTAAARFSKDSNVLDLWYQIFAAYSEIVAAQKNLDLSRENRDAFRKNADTALDLYRIGEVPKIEMVRAETEAQLILAGYMGAEERFRGACKNLLIRIGVREPIEFRVDTKPYAIKAGQEGMQELVDLALANRPDRKAILEKIASMSSRVKQIHGDHYPNLFVLAGFSYGGSYFDQLAWNWQAGVGLQLPLFSGLSTYRQARSAKARLAAARAELEQFDLEIRAQIEMAWGGLERYRITLQPLNAALISSQEGVNLAMERFKSGTGSQMEILDTQRSLAQARSQMVLAEYEYALAWASLVRALGTLPGNQE